MKNINTILLCLTQASVVLYGATFEELPKSQQLAICQKSGNVVKNRLELIELCCGIEDLSEYVAFLRGGYAVDSEAISTPGSMGGELLRSARGQIERYMRARFTHPEWDTDLVLILDGLSALALEASRRDAPLTVRGQFDRWLRVVIEAGGRIIEKPEWERFIRKWANIVIPEGMIIFESMEFLRENLLQSNRVLAIPGLPERIETFARACPAALEEERAAQEKRQRAEKVRIAVEKAEAEKKVKDDRAKEAEKLRLAEEARKAEELKRQREEAAAKAKAEAEAARKAVMEEKIKTLESKIQDTRRKLATAKGTMKTRFRKELDDLEKEKIEQENKLRNI